MGIDYQSKLQNQSKLISVCTGITMAVCGKVRFVLSLQGWRAELGLLESERALWGRENNISTISVKKNKATKT